MRLLDYSLKEISMNYNGKIYLFYEDYEQRYANTVRPALVRYTRTTRQDAYNNRGNIICTVFLDGYKSESTYLQGNSQNLSIKPYSITLLRPFHSLDEKLAEFNIEASKFNPQLESDWRYLFAESYMLHKNFDPLAYGLLAIALDKFTWENNTIKGALESFNNRDLVNIAFDMINYISWSLSPSKIEKIKDLNHIFGKECLTSFNPSIKELSNRFEVDLEKHNFYSSLDAIFEKIKNIETVENTSGILCIDNWLKDENAVISPIELQTYFPFFNTEKRTLIIKRFFLDVKNGRYEPNENLLDIFDSPNYEYYSRLRYIFEAWPLKKEVSTEFLFDCLRTYKLTNEKSFQVSDGILDWALQKSIQLQRPLDLKFHEWLCYCEGGVVLNKDFRGFADFECQYELDDFAFETDSLSENIKKLQEKRVSRLSHDEEQVIVDKDTGKPIIDQKTGKHKTETITIWEDKWEILPSSSERDELENELIYTKKILAEEESKYTKNHEVISNCLHEIEVLELYISDRDEKRKENKKIIDFFVNWDKRPDDLEEDGVYTKEMIDVEIIRENIEQYLLEKYHTTSPYLSERNVDPVVRMFMYPINMRATENISARLGVDPGVEESVVKERVKNRLSELFGDRLESEFDPMRLSIAQTDVQFRSDGRSDNCFVKSEKTYRGRHKIYCAPTLADLPNLLTGRKYATCGGDREMCFNTGIKKDPNWKGFGLIHILEILGHNVIEDTEAGYIPNQVYYQFVNQINKALRFYKRLTCRECGHILFPTQNHGHNRYKCMSPNCTEYNVEVYLNYCHKCKKGLIDSRDTKQCPNGLYICPDCGSCCSNSFFESMADRYRRQGKVIPAYISSKIGKGHKDAGQVFCAKCGAEKKLMQIAIGKNEIRCPKCEPVQEITQSEKM